MAASDSERHLVPRLRGGNGRARSWASGGAWILHGGQRAPLALCRRQQQLDSASTTKVMKNSTSPR